MISLRMNTAKFEEAIRYKAEKLKVEPTKILQEEMLALAVSCQKLTPPKSKQQGAEAIRRDVSRSIMLLTKDDFNRLPEKSRERMRQLIARRDYAGVASFLSHLGSWRNWRLVPFHASQHLSRRNGRGRVRGQARVATLDSAAYKKHLKDMQARSGIAKAGWNKSIMSLGGTLGQAYIARHGVKFGGVSVKGNGTEVVEITIYNDGIKVPDFQRTVDSALNIRARAIRKRTDIMLEKHIASD